MDYSSLYYITDNPECDLIYNNYIMLSINRYKGDEEASFDSFMIKPMDEDGNDMDFEEFITNKTQDEDDEFAAIYNAFIIFEMRSELKRVENDYQILFVDILEELFSEWKNNGCKIMLVFNTEESRLANVAQGYLDEDNYNGFLDYVDIHVNTDIFTIFVISMFYRIEEDLEAYDHKIYDVTIIFDKTLVTDEDIARLMEINDFSLNYYKMEAIFSKLSADSFLREFLFPYLMMVYHEYAKDNSSYLYEDILKNNNINLFCHISENSYFYLNEGMSIVLDEDNLNTMWNLAGDVYIVGTSSFGQTYTDEFLGYWKMKIDEYAFRDFHFYYYQDMEVDLTQFSDMNMRTAAKPGWNFEHITLPAIIDDFIYDDEWNQRLVKYDNFPGRCEITYKPIGYGPDGWLIFPGVFGDTSVFGIYFSPRWDRVYSFSKSPAPCLQRGQM